LHLIRASDKVALLFAPKGVGKSTLLSQLQHILADDVRVCRIDGASDITPETLVVHCLRGLGVDDNEIRLSSDHAELLQQRCLSLQNLNIKPLLFIDDVDQFSEDTLALIISWLAWQQDEYFILQAVLTAKNAMPELNTIHGRIQRVDLPSLSETEVSAYLIHRLASVGYQGEPLFKTKIVSHIYKKSSGIPQVINQLAHQELLGIKHISSSSATFMSWLKWISVGLVIVLLVLVLLFQDTINTFFVPEKEQSAMDQLSELIPEAEITTVITGSESQTSGAVDDMAEIITSEVSGAEPNVEEDEDQGRKELEQLLAELPVLELEQTEKKLTAVEPSTKSIQAKEKEVDTSAILHNKSSLYNQNEWVLRQDSSSYTFQLMGSWDKKNVVDYMRKYKLRGDVAIFSSKRNGQVWYALIYGVFDSKEKAQKASNGWPTTLKKVPKWLRSFESVQQQVQK
jgi:DamX protein